MVSRNFEYQGEIYQYLSEDVFKLKGGERVQVTDYKVIQDNGTIRYPYMICKVPDNYERIDLSKLSKDCIKRFVEGIVEFSEEELKNQ